MSRAPMARGFLGELETLFEEAVKGTLPAERQEHRHTHMYITPRDKNTTRRSMHKHTHIPHTEMHTPRRDTASSQTHVQIPTLPHKPEAPVTYRHTSLARRPQVLVHRRTCSLVPPGPALPGRTQPGLRSSPRHTRDFLAVLWPPCAKTSLVCGFLFLTDFMDPTDGEILDWVFGHLGHHLCPCLW